tara:strand:- start:12741 stop:14210 length:1470 start_codon:yes stop_codon:yes gene_type:complete
MAIKRYFATKDNTLTNAFKDGLTTRGTGSNMGEADIMEVFSIYGQATSASSELSRAIVQFDTTTISTQRTAGDIPASGSVDFYLKMSDAEHTESTPRQFTLTIAAVSQSWTEGTGLDTINYTDKGVSNWISASQGTAWTNEGGDFLTGSGDSFMFTSKAFDGGTEDLEVNVTSIVEEWLIGTTGSYGFGVFLTSSQETATESYYTKKFFARGSEFFHKRPVLEARWNDFTGDDSSNFYISSSRAPATDNLNTIYMYNYVRGQLVNIPSIGAGAIYVSLYSGSTGPTGSALSLPVGGDVASAGDTAATGGYVSTGIYSASLAYTSSSITSVYPVWHNNAGTEFFSGSAVTVKSQESAGTFPIKDWVINITNLKTTYSTDEVTKFRLYVRPKNWNPNLYTVAQTQIETTPIEKAYYQLTRVIDDSTIIAYGTGSGNESYTQLSYDASGNYFDLDIGMLQSGYTYQLSFLFNLVGDYSEQRTKFKFRVSDGD